MCEVGRYQLDIVGLTSIRTYTNTLGPGTSFLGTGWTLFHFEIGLGERQRAIAGVLASLDFAVCTLGFSE